MSVLAYHALVGTLYVSAGISYSSRHTVAYHVLAGTLYVSAGISCSSRHTVCQCWHIML